MSLKDFIEKKPELRTRRLLLRSLLPTDVDDLRSWLGDMSLYRYWGKGPGKDDIHPELLFQKQARPTKSFHWGIVHLDDSKVIGEFWVYLIENDRMAKVAFRLAAIYQRQGLMSEALEEVVKFCFMRTELQRLWTDVHVENIASYKTLERVGFRREGMIRQGKMVNTYCDYYLYGLLRSDFVC